jgi:STE24 endopeptidase
VFDASDAFLTAQEWAQLDAYHRPRHFYLIFDTVTTPVLFGLLVCCATHPLWRLSRRICDSVTFLKNAPGIRVFVSVSRLVWKGPGALQALVFMLLFASVMALWGLPSSVYFGYLHEKDFGLTQMNFGAFAFDWVKSHVLGFTAVAAVAVGLFGLARRLRGWWIVLSVVCVFGLQCATAIDPYRARLYVNQRPLESGPLRDALEATLSSAKVTVSDIVVETTSVKTVRLNAYFAGTGATRTVVLQDTLLKHLTTSEVVAVVAHEAAHVHQSRVLRQVLAALALCFLLGAMEWLFRVSARRGWFGIVERADVRVFPLVAWLFYLTMSVFYPVSLAYSRSQELRADAFAVALTNDVSSFRSMLVKAARVNKMNPSPPDWYVWLAMSHPPIAVRLAALESKVRPLESDGP